MIVTADTREMVLDASTRWRVEGLHIALVDNESNDGTQEAVRTRFGGGGGHPP